MTPRSKHNYRSLASRNRRCNHHHTKCFTLGAGTIPYETANGYVAHFKTHFMPILAQRLDLNQLTWIAADTFHPEGFYGEDHWSEGFFVANMRSYLIPVDKVESPRFHLPKLGIYAKPLSTYFDEEFGVEICIAEVEVIPIPGN